MKFYHVRTGLEGDISLYNTLVGLFLSLYVFENKKMCTFWNLQFLFVFFSQALHNTHLLATYAAIDRRVKILCYVMKVFAKVNMLYRLVTKTSLSVLAIVLFNVKMLFPLPLQMCDIGDASRGSLSSYAYTLMVLFFLQQRDPPVIPVLQEVQMSVWKKSQLYSLYKLHIDVLICLCECCLKYIYPLKLNNKLIPPFGWICQQVSL